MLYHPAHNLAQAKIMVKETLQYTVVKNVPGSSQRNIRTTDDK